MKENIFVNLDKEIEFEKINFLYKFLYNPLFSIVALWVALKKAINSGIKTNFYFFDGASFPCRLIKENSKNWRALNIIYNYQFGNGDGITDFWLNIRNAQAVRNRLKIVKYLLEKNIADLVSRHHKEIRICSIASGSAQALIEAVAAARKRGVNIRCVLIDLDSTAHDYAKNLARIHGVGNIIDCRLEKASFIETIGREFKPLIIEMVGFLEYRNDNQTVELTNRIYEALQPGGTFLTSQIAPNGESFFMREVINWPMIYRIPGKFKLLIEKSNFGKRSFTFYLEPQKIHFVIEAKKI